jgi:hypothetical protein
MASEMTNVLISLILGLCLLVVAAFYALIVGAAVCCIAAGLGRSFGTIAPMRNMHVPFHPGQRHLQFPAPLPEMAVATGILSILAAGFGWTASSLFRYCGLFLLVVAPSTWILVRHLKK